MSRLISRIQWSNFSEDLCPQDMILLLQSNDGNFLLQKFGVVWVFIDLPGVVIWHPHFIHTEKRAKEFF